MLVKDLQQFLSKFTEADAAGTRQGNAITNAVIFVEMEGKLHEIKRMEVHEHSSPIIGYRGKTAHRLVMKTQKASKLLLPEKLKNDYQCSLKKHMGPEAKLYKKLKTKTPRIIWNRIENLSIVGMPDLLGYNGYGHFFTVELKVTSGNKIKFSPHQIAWHVAHPQNTFILAEALGPRLVKLFRGSRIRELAACGFKLESCCLGLGTCAIELETLGA